MILDEFERPKNYKYLSEMYYGDTTKEFYELQMGFMTDDVYTSRFIELLRYVSYLKDEKENIQRIISGFPTSYRDWIKFDEPQSLEKAIKKLKHYYE